jgi:O-antigen/teichoic acid export membrane protein
LPAFAHHCDDGGRAFAHSSSRRCHRCGHRLRCAASDRAHCSSRTGIGKAATNARDAKPSASEYLKFLLPLIVAQAGLNLLLQTDLLLLSEAAGEHARTTGLDAKEADKLLAPYRAVQLFGFLPYQLLMSVQFVLFPLLAKASAENASRGDRLRAGHAPRSC